MTKILNSEAPTTYGASTILGALCHESVVYEEEPNMHVFNTPKQRED